MSLEAWVRASGERDATPETLGALAEHALTEAVAETGRVR